MKFLFGHLLEEMLLFLAAEAGHTVAGRQDRLEIDGVPGHGDAIIDGMLVDVKSASTMAFKVQEPPDSLDTDDFGYLQQLNAYLEAPARTTLFCPSRINALSLSSTRQQPHSS